MSRRGASDGFLDRIDQLRDGTAASIDADSGRAAVELLATRKIVDAAREADLRALIETARRGAQPDEVILAPEIDLRRREIAETYINWLNEWREVARVAISRRDFRIALGLAQRRQSNEEGDTPMNPASPTGAAAANCT